MAKRIISVLLIIAVLMAAVCSSVAEYDEYYQEISVNYASIAFDTGTDPDLWWNSEEPLQATFGLLVSLDLADAIPEFDLQISTKYPSVIFGVCTKATAGTDGACFAFLVDGENGKYLPVTCDLNNKVMLCSSHPTDLFALREARLFLVALCGENVKEISNESMQTAASFLQEQFAAAQK